MSRRALGLLLSLVIILAALVAFASRARWVHGYVRDADTGQPLAGALVTVGAGRTATGADGYFQIGGIRGLPTVRASADGYSPASVSEAIASLIGARRGISLELRPVELRGTVTDAKTRHALAGATVKIGGREVQTDGRGRYSIKGLLPGGQITARATYYAESQPVDYTGQAAQDIPLDLLPVTVMVRNLFSGEPLPGATVKGGGMTTKSDAQGQIVYARLQPRTELVGSLEGFQEGRVTVSPGDNVTLGLRPPLIDGKVTDQAGKPLEKALILLRIPGQEPRLTYTNAQGEYIIQGVPTEGTLLVRVAGYKRLERQLGKDVGTDFQLEPFAVKGIYINFGMLWPEAADLLRYDLDLVDRTELNAVVIDVKSDRGYLAFQPQLPVAREIGAYDSHVVDIRQVLQECKRRNIYTIARMVIFKDDVLALGRPEWGVQSMKGGLWRDDIGAYYSDPFRKEVWDYNRDLAVEAAEMGFDEIQLDYLRFPSDGNIYDTSYIKEDNRANRTTAIADFVAYVRQGLEKTGAFFSLDLFGLTTSINLDLKYGDLGIGQELAMVAPYADFISPMLYPSTYIPGNLGLTDPKRNPYQVVKISIQDGHDRAGGTLIRPWLQHYSLYGITYGAQEFRLEKQAAMEAGAVGWMFWNAGGVYEEAALDP